MSLWGTRSTQQYEKYLGLIYVIGKSRKMAFSELNQGFGNAYKCRKRSYYFKGSRDKEVMLKVVALAIPMYVMICFKPPITLFFKFENLNGLVGIKYVCQNFRVD